MEDNRIIIARKKFLNKKFKNSDGDIFEVIEYIGYTNITVRFEDNIIVKNVNGGTVNSCSVRHPNYNMYKNFHNTGYLGIGKYNSKNNPYYQIWVSMIRRCYSKELKFSTYVDCSVDEKWHNFQNFAEWCEKNYVDSFALDKDILIKRNKIYSENTCCFVPSEINNLFTKTNKLRGDLPIGVTLNNQKTKFHAQFGINGKKIHLGFHDSVEVAFQAYKEAKENYIKKTADYFKDEISVDVFNALYNYEVEITD